MISTFSSALSGLSAFADQIAVVANNTANIHTEGFEKSRAVLHPTHPNGVAVHVETLPPPGPMATTPTPDSMRLVEPSNVDLAEDMATLLMTHRAYQANLKILKAKHERVGHLVDIVR